MSHPLLYEGKAKLLYATDDPAILRVVYKNDATAFNGKKFAQLEGKAELNNSISSFFFEYLREHGIPSHYVRKLSDTEQLVRRVSIIPLEVVVRNVAAGSLSKRIGWEEGRDLPDPIVEFYYKDDALGDPLLTEDHIRLLGIADETVLEELRGIGFAVNRCLREFLEPKGLRLIDFKLEFGRDANGTLTLADEISPDTCRFWDAESDKKLDKDRFRRDLGGVMDAYEEVLRRIAN